MHFQAVGMDPFPTRDSFAEPFMKARAPATGKIPASSTLEGASPWWAHPQRGKVEKVERPDLRNGS